MKKLALLLALLLAPLSAFAQNAITLPIAANAVADLGNGPIKVRMVAGNASIFTSQGSGVGSTSGSSTALTLTATPATPPLVGGLISGAGITSGTTVVAYNGTTGITLSAAMTVTGSTPVAWGAACPSTPPSNVIQASPMADSYIMFTQARVCAVSPGGPVNTLLIEPIFYDQTTPNGGSGGVSFANPSANAGPAAVNGSAPTAMRSDSAPAISVLGSGGANQIPVYPGSGGQFVPTAISGFFDAVCSSTIGQSWVRLTGGWGCLSLGYANPVWWGAVADAGSSNTDNSPFAKSARQALDAIGGGEMRWPAGSFCLKTVDANGAAIAINAHPIAVTGAGIGVTSLDTCGADISIVYANIVGAQLKNFSYLAKGAQSNPADTTFGAATSAIVFDTACGLCKIDYVRGFGGWFAIDNKGFDSFIEDFSFGYTYGFTIYHGAGGGHRIMHGALDQNWPVVVPNGNSLTVSAWQASHAYSGNGVSNTNVVTTNGYNIQLVSASCTSGGTAPTLKNYGTAITDGTCSWQLVGASIYFALDCDGNCSEMEAHGEVDLSCGGCTAPFAMSNSNAGTAPFVVNIEGASIGGGINAGVELLAGFDFTMTNSHLSAPVLSGGNMLVVPASGFVGGASLSNNRFNGAGDCIAIGTLPSGHSGYVINGNRFESCGTGIQYFNTAGALHITAGNNTFLSVSTVWNTPAGSSFYNFSNNDINGGTITFTGGDANKTVTGNN